MKKCNLPISTETLGLPKGSARVTSYKKEWPLRFSEEKVRILNMFECHNVEIHHIGSTSVPGLRSKPVIDMAMVFKNKMVMPQINTLFKQLGYICHKPRKKNESYWYEYGKDLTFFQVYIFSSESKEFIRLLKFTQILIDNEEDRMDYQRLKDYLSKQYGNDPQGYVRGKRKFINQLIEKYASN